MRISIFIVTYKNDELLHRCLDSIFRDVDKNSNGDTVTVTVLNNYDRLCLHDMYSGRVNVIDNLARPSFSTGHLSRSWNQCILHGFRDVNNPSTDILILAQNDIMFKEGFIEVVKQATKQYNYIAMGRGDEVQVMTIDAVKNIGMYDERFCNIGFQEADYFLRAVLLNREKSSINDAFHSRVHNPIPNNIIEDVPCGYMRGDQNHVNSSKYHIVSQQMFYYKWLGLLPFHRIPLEGDSGIYRYPYEQWNDYIKSIPVCAKQYIMYPYFECNLPDLQNKYINYEHVF